MAAIDDALSLLNPPQREAVVTTEGAVLVLAGAGSGKTRVITTRIAYLLAQGLCAPENILAVTFTNKAAQEMRERVATLTGADQARRIVISTFHSFCVRVLRQEIERLGYRRNFTISSEGDARTLLRRCLEDIDDAREAYDAGAFLERIGSVKSAGLDDAIDPSGLEAAAFGEEPPVPDPGDRKGMDAARTREKYRARFADVYQRYQSALRAANAVDFDDLLLLTLRLWRDHPEVAARYRDQFRYVMVDEYQDTNGVQYALLMEVVRGRGNLCVVGDDDQSIYGWRGADIGNILNFERDFPGACVVTLAQNYRSRQTILDAANAVIARNAKRRPKDLWSRLGQGRKIDWFTVADDEQEAREAVAWLKFIQTKSAARYSDFAVLYRSNQQSRAFEVALRAAGIPYVVVGGQEFFERAEVRDIVAYLKVIANPRDEAALLRIVNVPRRGIGDTTMHQALEVSRREGLSVPKALARMLERGGLAQNTEAGIRHFLGVLSGFRKRFRSGAESLTALCQDLLDTIAYRDELLRTCKSPAQFEARWNNVQTLMKAVMDYEEGEEAGSLSGFLDQSALVTDDDRRAREERRRDGVTLMTVHSAKGLEFPFVFVVGVEEGLFPHEKSLGETGLEEERRLFYVALTRAQRHVTLFDCCARDRYGKRRVSRPSRFLEEIPRELLQPQVRAARDMVEEAVAPKPERMEESEGKTQSRRRARQKK